jgi:hypothetical protein
MENITEISMNEAGQAEGGIIPLLILGLVDVALIAYDAKLLSNF